MLHKENQLVVPSTISTSTLYMPKRIHAWGNQILHYIILIVGLAIV